VQGREAFLHMHGGKSCNKIFYLQRETDISCKICSEPMIKLSKPYEEYTRLDEEERKEFIGQDIQKHIQSDIRKGD